MATDVADKHGFGDPLEIVLTDPGDYLNLYSYTFLLDSHPVRIVIPVIAGFSKAVKLAVALNFAVKLEMRQPDQQLLKEVEESSISIYIGATCANQSTSFTRRSHLSFTTIQSHFGKSTKRHRQQLKKIRNVRRVSSSIAAVVISNGPTGGIAAMASSEYFKHSQTRPGK